MTNSFKAGDVVDISTPTSDMSLRSRLIVELTQPPEMRDGRLIVTGCRKIGRRVRPYVSSFITTSIRIAE